MQFFFLSKVGFPVEACLHMCTCFCRAQFGDCNWKLRSVLLSSPPLLKQALCDSAPNSLHSDFISSNGDIDCLINCVRLLRMDTDTPGQRQQVFFAYCLQWRGCFLPQFNPLCLPLLFPPLLSSSFFLPTFISLFCFPFLSSYPHHGRAQQLAVRPNWVLFWMSL